ncbi:MAG TPA: MAPEG family protein [Woeseiaceae bacterium]
MELLAIVTILALLQLLVFASDVGKARMRTGIKAPAMGGHPDLERHQRVHQNTIEQLVIFLPALWLFGTYLHEMAAAALGILFIIGRFMYRSGYVEDPAKRHNGFMVGIAATVILLLGGLVGAALSLLRG